METVPLCECEEDLAAFLQYCGTMSQGEAEQRAPRDVLRCDDCPKREAKCPKRETEE